MQRIEERRGRSNSQELATKEVSRDYTWRRYCYEKKCLLIVICIVCALVFGLGECDTIYADTVRSTGENEYTTTYAVPEGGWSTITFRVQLSEQFTYNYS